jgi:cyclophilin family peptidyl-prolyl cis-trans isomerase
LLEADQPQAVENFRLLAEHGYYNGLTFHRIVKGFMIQGGDPTGTGSGGPGYTFEDEFNDQKVERGALAMANAGPNTNGSQFFIMHIDYPLPPSYTKFGKVIEGQDVIDDIANVKTNEKDKPLEPIVMNRVYIEEAA